MMIVTKGEPLTIGTKAGETQLKRGCLLSFWSARKASMPPEIRLPESLDQVCKGNSPAVKVSL